MRFDGLKKYIGMGLTCKYVHVGRVGHLSSLQRLPLALKVACAASNLYELMIRAKKPMAMCVVPQARR